MTTIAQNTGEITWLKCAKFLVMSRKRVKESINTIH